MKKQEGRKKENNKRETKKEKGKKGGGPNKAKEKQRETQINKQKWPFLGGKAGFSFLKANKEKAKEKKKQKKTNKEGLGPSEVALWATSPDP